MSLLLKVPGGLLLDETSCATAGPEGAFAPPPIEMSGEGEAAADAPPHGGPSAGPEESLEGVVIAMSPALRAVAFGVLYLEQSLHREGRSLTSQPRKEQLLEGRTELCRLRNRLLADFGRLQGLLAEVQELTCR